MKMVFIGDFAVATGFGSVNEALLTRVPTDWTLHILGINTSGDPHPLRQRFPNIYPAKVGGGDAFGVMRAPALIDAAKPDVVVIHQDAWIAATILEACAMKQVPMPPVLVYAPPDAPNQPAGARLTACGVKTLLAPTAFGIRELELGGYEGATAVLPYGVDTSVFVPHDRRLARQSCYLPEDRWDGFIVGRGDRNASRKRYDLTIDAFAHWYREAGEPADAWLYTHCSVRDVGIDLLQWAAYRKIDHRLIYTSPNHSPGVGMPRTLLPKIYSTWDVNLAQAHEGFGLVALESAACGIPQIALRYAAYAEWLDGAARFVEPGPRYAMPGGINTEGAVPTVESLAEAIDEMYRSPQTRLDYGARALGRATSSTYDWNRIAAEFVRHVEATCG